MSLVAFSSSRTAPQEDLHPFERLAVRLSSSFSALRAEDVDDTVAHALEEIGPAFEFDECTLLGFEDDGDARVVQSWAAHPHPACTQTDLKRMPWLVQRLARNTVVVMTPTTDLPHAALGDRAHAERSGVSGRLAVPIVVGTRVSYALMAGSRQRHPEWRVPVIDRLRLLGEILGSGLARARHGDAAAAARPDGERPADDTGTDPVRAESSGTGVSARIIGDSPSLKDALARMERVAPLDATVLLLGETGTGKELFARALHESSKRKNKRLVSINCAVLPATLIESELFGHERGAFTGAIAQRQGRFELAERGTLFLDEIGDLPLDLQAKLLRVLQEGEFERVGSSDTRRADVRIIAATHVDLAAAVADGRFRADLYYRLGVFPITLPPLRDRPEDIPRLVWHFIDRHSRALSRRITTVPDEVMHALQAHDWPGNVRELENVVARAMIRSNDGLLELDAPLQRGGLLALAAMPPQEIEDAETLDAVQRRHIERVLRECGWRINGAGNAAVRLGVHPNTLRFRIKKLGVVRPTRGRSATEASGAHSA